MKTSVQQLMRFCSVGAVGFMVDTSITLLLVRLASAAPVWARIAAFICGASVTWMLNKHFTFRAEGGFKRWTMYMSLTAIGALLNVGVYALWIGRHEASSQQIVLGIFWGALVALAFNFSVSKYVIFQRRLGSS